MSAPREGGPKERAGEEKSFQERRPRAGSPLEEERGSGAWPVIRLEEGPARQVRVIGSLEGPALQLLSDVVSRGPLILDLSELDYADESGVRLLAELPPERRPPRLVSDVACTVARTGASIGQ